MLSSTSSDLAMFLSICLILCIFRAASGYIVRPVRTLTARRNIERIYEGVEGARDLEGQGAAAPELSDEIKREFKAIRQYKEIYGNLAVDSTFVVPSADFSWPEDTWGLKLGSVVDKIKTTDDYDKYKEELEDIGSSIACRRRPCQALSQLDQLLSLDN